MQIQHFEIIVEYMRDIVSNRANNNGYYAEKHGSFLISGPNKDIGGSHYISAVDQFDCDFEQAISNEAFEKRNYVFQLCSKQKSLSEKLRNCGWKNFHSTAILVSYDLNQIVENILRETWFQDVSYAKSPEINLESWIDAFIDSYKIDSLSNQFWNNRLKCDFQNPRWVHGALALPTGEYASIISIYNGDKSCTMTNLGTLHLQRGKGYGTTLSMEALVWLREFQKPSIFSCNNYSVNIYRKLGFQEVGKFLYFKRDING